MATTVRKQAPRLAQPIGRYWKGKAPKGAADLPSDESDEEKEEVPQEEGDVAFAGEQEFLRTENDDEEKEEEEEEGRKGHRTGKMSVALKNVNISKEGKVIVAGKQEVGRTEAEELSEESGEESDAKASSRDETDESSESESEEEEEKPKLQFRPVFVPKRSRVTAVERQALAEDSEEAIRKKEIEAEERKKQSHDLVAESIRRELLEKEKEEEVVDVDVDDTDGVDPSGEFDAWRLRELARIKRDKEAEVARELEREEVERRRALPEEQRLKEDLEHAKKSRDEKPKGKQMFLQKYWHKGAFHQDQEILQRHDFTEATGSTMDVSLLPQVMQVKNFGKRGRTKYTHLVDQDTTLANSGFGSVGPGKAGGMGTDSGGCFLCGGPHMKKDCPQNVDALSGRPGTGPNAAPTGIRNERQSWRDDDGRRPRQAHESYKGRERLRDDRDGRDRYRPRSAELGRGGGDYEDRRRFPSDEIQRETLRERRRSRSRSVEARNNGDEKRRRVG